MRLPNSVLAFTANDEERKNAYSKFVEYYESYVNGKKNSANGTTFEEMNSKMLEFYKDEVKKMRELGYWRIYDCGNKVWSFDR